MEVVLVLVVLGRVVVSVLVEVLEVLVLEVV